MTLTTSKTGNKFTIASSWEHGIHEQRSIHDTPELARSVANIQLNRIAGIDEPNIK